MANDTILSPPSCEEDDEILEVTPEKYLLINNCLSEYSDNESYKERVRTNLDIPSLQDKEVLERSISNLSSKLKELLLAISNTDDPYVTQSLLEEFLKNLGYVKQDGSIPFTRPLKGVTPKSSNDLTTLGYVIDKIKEHSDRLDDPHNTLKLVQDLLDEKRYVTCLDVYKRNKLYTKTQIDDLVSNYVKTDGSTPFMRPQSGQYPKFDSHLSTKRYVDDLIYNHETSIDPHGYSLLLNNKLASYAKTKNVYDKSETYSRTLLDSIIDKLVNDYAESAIEDHVNLYDPHDMLRKMKNEGFIKKDGSVPFINPLRGVDAEEDDELVTLKLLVDAILQFKDNDITYKWKTSGPVETTVGYVEDNTLLNPIVSFQEIMDAIFYGKMIKIFADEYATIGTPTDITICLHGSLINVVQVELFLNGELIETFEGSQFADECVTVPSNPIFDETEFEARVTYSDGITYSASTIVKVACPLFVGLLPYISFAANLTYEDLENLVRTTNENLNKFFYNVGDNLTSISMEYIFLDAKLRKPFIVVPEYYPDLDSLVTSCLNFGEDAFEPPVVLPMRLGTANKVVYYKVYVYKLALSSLNQTVTFNFKSKTSE